MEDLVNDGATAEQTTSSIGRKAAPKYLQDVSYVEAVTAAVTSGVHGFLSYLPSAVVKSLPVTSKDSSKRPKVTWARFETVDVHPVGTDRPPSLFLCLGYEDGCQIWNVDDIENIHEVVSIRSGPVRCIKPLEAPVMDGTVDEYATSRPHLIIVSVDQNQKPSSYSVKFMSLKTYEVVHVLRFKTEVYDVHCNARYIAVVLRDQIFFFYSHSYKNVFSITNCPPNPHHGGAVMCMGTRWIAYATNQAIQSGSTNRAAARLDQDITTGQKLVTAAKDVVYDIAQGLYKFGDMSYQAVSSYLSSDATGNASSSAHSAPQTSSQVSNVSSSSTGASASQAAGIVMVRDPATRDPIAHFQAHSAPICALAFNPNGSLLATASMAGYELNVFQILPSTNREGGHSHPTHRHLYKLVRGTFTNAIIEHIAFNVSSRWMAVSTARGTTHIFPINPVGGPVNVFTHTTAQPDARHKAMLNAQANARAQDKDGKAYVTLSAYERIHMPLPPEDDEPSQPSGSSSPSSSSSASTVSGQANVLKRKQPIAAHFYYGETHASDENSSDSTGLAQRLFCFSPTGVLTYNVIRSTAVEEQGSDEDKLQVKVEQLIEWSLLRQPSWPQVHPVLEPGNNNHSLYASNHKTQTAPPMSPSTSSSRSGNLTWLANVEIATHAQPERPIWMGPQFTFKTFQPRQSNGSDDISDDLDDFPAKELNVRPGIPVPYDESAPAPRADMADEMQNALETHVSFSPYPPQKDVDFDDDAFMVPHDMEQPSVDNVPRQTWPFAVPSIPLPTDILANFNIGTSKENPAELSSAAAQTYDPPQSASPRSASFEGEEYVFDDHMFSPDGDNELADPQQSMYVSH